jgi:hypothetical protein
MGMKQKKIKMADSKEVIFFPPNVGATKQQNETKCTALG